MKGLTLPQYNKLKKMNECLQKREVLGFKLFEIPIERPKGKKKMMTAS